MTPGERIARVRSRVSALGPKVRSIVLDPEDLRVTVRRLQELEEQVEKLELERKQRLLFEPAK